MDRRGIEAGRRRPIAGAQGAERGRVIDSAEIEITSGSIPPALGGRVAVVHPGVQHSRELVRALHEGGLLSRFVTSFDGGAAAWQWLPTAIRAKLRYRAVEGVPSARVVTIPYVEAVNAALGLCLTDSLRRRFDYGGLALFDRLAAKPALQVRPRVVVGFENGCRHLFRRAKTAGALCVLDAASVHHSAQTFEPGAGDAAFWERVNVHKDEEIALADRIVVLSGYAKETYVAAGVPDDRIAVIQPGVRLSSPAESKAEKARGIRFLFVGNVKFAKGIDLLLGAFARLDAMGKRLSIVGAIAEPWMLPTPLPEGVEVVGKLGRDALSKAYAAADVLVLPSRADGFGFVVAEAMAAGLPIIVSSATGAKDLVEHEVSGWIFTSGSEPGLHDAMRAAAGRRGLLREMGLRARSAVQALTWDRYGDRIRAFYGGLLAGANSCPSGADALLRSAG